MEVIATAKLYPSEDVNKVAEAIRNVINNARIEVKDDMIIGYAKGREALYKVYEQARNRQVLGVLRKALEDNILGNTTWFYLNKQAAYNGVVVICFDPEESPLDPIKVEVKDEDIEGIIEWLTKI